LKTLRYIFFATVAIHAAVIAVLPLGADSSISAAQRRVVTWELQSALTLQSGVDVVDQSKLAAVLSEQDFQQSDVCNTKECRVRVGMNLGVEQIVTGKVWARQDSSGLDLEVVDARTGAVLAAQKVSLAGDLGATHKGLGLLAVARISAQLQGVTTSEGNREVYLTLDSLLKNNAHLDDEQLPLIQGLNKRISSGQRERLREVHSHGISTGWLNVVFPVGCLGSRIQGDSWGFWTMNSLVLGGIGLALINKINSPDPSHPQKGLLLDVAGYITLSGIAGGIVRGFYFPLVSSRRLEIALTLDPVTGTAGTRMERSY
jgi:hypothetical protein